MELRKLIPLSVLLLSGCQREQWDDCITSAGPMRDEERSVGDFHTIDLDDRVDLVIEERAFGSVSVEAGNNLLGQITTEVNDGILSVRNEMRCNWVRSFKPRVTVHVPVDQVAKLVLRGTGNVTCADTIIRDRFELEQWSAQGSTDLLLNVTSCSIALHSGAGDVTVHGRCMQTADLFSGIQGAIDATDFQSRFVNVNNSGIADIRCWVTEQLDVQLRDVGDVYYRGDPFNVQSTITGSGSLIHE
jgi:Putative auto-transporter adhesin, head GIN domain